MPIIPPASATAFVVRKGQILRITDVEGGQVADLVCFNLNDRNEFFSQAGTRLHNGKVRISTGDDLYSNLNNVMFKKQQGYARPNSILSMWNLSP
ncbi:MAG: urea carboxylase-associated family protein [Desulfotomaculaceae bacterium]|nr:urea carboxylase-associated family protein [Desulfotomaculaceae bacterium]